MVGESEPTLQYQNDARDVLHNKILPYLKEHGKDIGRKAYAGDALCKEIMARYELVYKFAEHISIGLLEASIDEYQKRSQQNG